MLHPVVLIFRLAQFDVIMQYNQYTVEFFGHSFLLPACAFQAVLSVDRCSLRTRRQRSIGQSGGGGARSMDEWRKSSVTC